MHADVIFMDEIHPPHIGTPSGFFFVCAWIKSTKLELNHLRYNSLGLKSTLVSVTIFSGVPCGECVIENTFGPP